MALDASWNEELLKIELQELENLNFDITLTGFSLEDLNLNFDLSKNEMYSDDISDKIKDKYELAITCENENDLEKNITS